MHPVYFLLSAGLLILTVDNAMIVTWGVPQPIASCQTGGAIAWKKCVQNCTDTFLCLVASTDLKGNCYWCQFNTFKSVTKSSSTKGWKVAFKVSIDPKATSCPIGANAPTFNNATVTGDLSTYEGDAYTRNYTLTFTGAGWTYSFYEKRRCNDSFYYFKRPNVEWCMGVFMADTSGSYQNAVDGCPNFSNSKLSGIATKVEWQYLKVTIPSLRPLLSTPNTAACMSISGFTRIDKYVTNFNALSWVTNSAAGATTGKQCMVTVFDEKNDGKQDFAECDAATDPPTLAILCGFRAF